MSFKTEKEFKNPQQIKMLLWSVFAGSKGCINRVKIVLKIKQTPLNINQLSQVLGLDYKVVEHHMKTLEKNNLVTKIGEKYGAMFHISNFLEYNIGALDEAIDKLDRKMNSKKVYL
ncbi:hypothetical protein LCGC14_2638070 [marine sediment metagenome]|uniref:HTH arsR-type domain-containing protein n=1 Tax=marine sediment metagenome TaxID=412755 RepID=A0A0F9AKV3_9ZZZZ